jgi:hypothetical protein
MALHGLWPCPSWLGRVLQASPKLRASGTHVLHRPPKRLSFEVKQSMSLKTSDLHGCNNGSPPQSSEVFMCNNTSVREVIVIQDATMALCRALPARLSPQPPRLALALRSAAGYGKRAACSVRTSNKIKRFGYDLCGSRFGS